jgi:hypothetical protein
MCDDVIAEDRPPTSRVLSRMMLLLRIGGNLKAQFLNSFQWRNIHNKFPKNSFSRLPVVCDGRTDGRQSNFDSSSGVSLFDGV